jgi:hypothetical protein
MRERRLRRWQAHDEADPLAGLVNLFDLWMVFSIAILIVFAGLSRRREPATADDGRPAGARQSAALHQAQPLRRFRLSRDQLQGTGERLGTAYRLPSGEVVCVPEDGHPPQR